jgi:hypothetical protein
MAPGFLVLFGVAFLVGAPLAIGATLVGFWMRRANRACALKTYVGAASAGAVSFLAFFGSIAALIAIVIREERQPGYFEEHPFLPLLMIGLFLLTLVAGLACAFCCAWTVWRLAAAPPAPALTVAAGT